MNRYTFLRTNNAGIFDYVYFDAFEVVEREYNATVPEYPTEAGNKVSDAVLKSLPRVTGNGVISSFSLNRAGAHSESEMLAACERLWRMYVKSQLLTLAVAGSEFYTDLIIESLRIKKDSSMTKAVTVDLSFKQMKFPVATIAKFYIPGGDDASSSEESSEEGSTGTPTGTPTGTANPYSGATKTIIDVVDTYLYLSNLPYRFIKDVYNWSKKK